MTSTYTISTKINLVTEECYKCHIVFAIPEDLQKRAKASRDVSFYCPNGHGQSYTQSEEMRLRHQLDQREAELEHLHGKLNEALQTITTKKREITRIKNRIHNGVCPECHRHFENLERHMNTKHQEGKKNA
jgi:hypothetical protein